MRRRSHDWATGRHAPGTRAALCLSRTGARWPLDAVAARPLRATRGSPKYAFTSAVQERVSGASVLDQNDLRPCTAGAVAIRRGVAFARLSDDRAHSARSTPVGFAAAARRAGSQLA